MRWVTSQKKAALRERGCVRSRWRIQVASREVKSDDLSARLHSTLAMIVPQQLFRKSPSRLGWQPLSLTPSMRRVLARPDLTLMPRKGANIFGDLNGKLDVLAHRRLG